MLSPLKSPANLAAFLDARRAEGLSMNSIATYRTAVLQFQKWLTERADSARTDARTIRALVVEWLGENAAAAGWGASTARLKWSAIAEYLRFLALDGILTENPLEGIQGPKTERRIPRYHSPETIRLMLDHWAVEHWVCEHWREPAWLAIRNLVLLELLYATGARVAEILALNEDDYNPGRMWLTVTGKGNKQRQVPLSRRAREFLGDLLMESALLPKTKPFPLFVSHRGKRLERTAVFRLIKETAAAVGISPPPGPHAFRHACATHMVENGANLRAVQQILGHASIEITAQYVHFSPRRLIEAHRRFFIHPREANPSWRDALGANNQREDV